MQPDSSVQVSIHGQIVIVIFSFCKLCSTAFIRKLKHQTFCCDKCKIRWNNAH